MSEQINPIHGTRDGAECPGCSHESHFQEKTKSDICRAEPGPKAPPHAMNSRFILESYKEDRALKATVSNGFAMVQQKVSLKGLIVLADVYSQVTGQCLARKGDKAFIREASLQSQPWAKAAFTSDAIEGEFIICEATYVEFVDHK